MKTPETTTDATDHYAAAFDEAITKAFREGTTPALLFDSYAAEVRRLRAQVRALTEALERIAADYDHAKGFCGWCDVTAEGHEDGCPTGIAREALVGGSK